MKANPIKLLITTEEFFATPLKKLSVEDVPATGRTYFLKRGRIVAVATQPGETR